VSGVEESVREFYDNFGWETSEGVTGDEALFRQYSAPHAGYQKKINARVAGLFADSSGSLLIAGGGDLTAPHLEIAERFDSVCCLDISERAVEMAREKLAEGSECIQGSVLDIPKPDDAFDAVFCAHVIYHIDEEQQAAAVRELTRVTRPGGLICIIYSNPRSLFRVIAAVKRRLPVLRTLKRAEPSGPRTIDKAPRLYFHPHPLGWWKQFRDECEVKLLPWKAMSVGYDKQLLFNDRVAAFAYRFCAWFERWFPALAARWWTYPVVLLTKKRN